MEEGSRKNRKSRLASGSSKNRPERLSQLDNPYSSDVNDTHNEADMSNMININTGDDLNRTDVVIREDVLETDVPVRELNNSQERPLTRKQHDRGLIPNSKAGKRRIFSSTGQRPRKNRVPKNRNRIQTAKYVRNVNRVVNYCWRGGSSTGAYKSKPKRQSATSKQSEKKKQIPLAEYQWPENNFQGKKVLRLILLQF